MPPFIVLFGLSAPAATPSYVLDAGDVVLMLPDGDWHLERWSADTLRVTLERPAGALRLAAWHTPVQVPVTSAETWARVFDDHAATLGGPPRSLERAELGRVESRPVAFVDLGFVGTDGVPQALSGATLEVAAGNLHVAITGPSAAAGDTTDVLSGVLSGLAADLPPSGRYGATVAVPGVQVALPAQWRPPLDVEDIEVDEGCAAALAPRPATEPARLTVCHDEVFLGVVDEYSFAVLEPEVRVAFFDGPVDPGEPLAVGDQTGFRYRLGPDHEVGLVPHIAGITRLDLQAPEPGDLDALIRHTSLDGPHPASIADRVWYWLWVRPTSLPVLAELDTVLGGMVAAARLTRRTAELPP
ncbi:MAG: hypothetical protein AAF211_00650 [Myxococcota bacterium]